ncbi:MAG: hypothetical protein EPO08_11695 [Rhodospirillaceae bacterium]|nr:MAG: hypothetical protein EPO08_11695 [Rhodospirillaceae bacterium]
MIFLFTDFGYEGPYLGQVCAVLARQAPGIPVIPLFSDVPSFDPRGAAYLLAAYTTGADRNDIVMAVVDPGVGTARRPIVLRADERWYVGPDNGLLAVVAQRAVRAETWEIGWTPVVLSNTFHGRDLFAPVAARLACGDEETSKTLDLKPVNAIEGATWPEEYPAIVYFDRYGNGITGCRARSLGLGVSLRIGAHRIEHAMTFADQPKGAALWYENANGLAEIAVNCGNAKEVLGLALGDVVARA